MLGANWREELRRRWGIQMLDEVIVAGNQVLWVTRCCRVKAGVPSGTPEELYVSPVNRYFYMRMHQFGVKFGVLSDKYGLHLYNHRLPWYDIHPGTLTSQDKKRLGELIRTTALSEGFSQIVFYSPSPLMSVPYFEMLHYSGLAVTYTTRLTASDMHGAQCQPQPFPACHSHHRSVQTSEC